MELGSTPAVTITELEGSLNQIAGVRAVRIVASPDGRIEEVHVLGLPGKAPKQLVRDIESALMALYGIAIDRRLISIAQIGVAEEPETVAETTSTELPAGEPTVEPAEEASQPEPARPPIRQRRVADVHPIGAPKAADQRVRILGVDVDSDSLRTTVRVRLASEGGQVSGEGVGPASKTAVLRLVAEATLKAVEKLAIAPRCYAVEDCSIMTLGGRPVSVCSIVTVTSEGEQVLSGSAVVRHTAESATARATLDALNRRLGL